MIAITPLEEWIIRVTDPLHAVEAAVSFGAHCIVGIPNQILALARSPTELSTIQR